jgi:ribonucleoside-diphosphate reductase alpha chain
MQVQKRNGDLESYNVEKIHKVVDWAIKGLNNVSLSEIEMNANLSLRDGISTKEIHQILIKSANDLTSPQTPNYQYVASRLLNMSLRKDLWQRYDSPPTLYDHILANIEHSVYDVELFNKWTKADIDDIAQGLDHDRDYLFTYAGLQQLMDKYLVKNRVTGKIYETPQFAYICIAMALFDSVKEVLDAYECFSSHKINLPTPIMAGVRTKIKQFASCVLVDVEDDLASIFSSVHAVGKYTARRAGIGLNVGRIRPINSEIRGGEVVHTGLIPYLKIFESTVKATSQNGIRGGSATVHVPFWHYEIEDIVMLKNNAGTDDNRVRKLDYSVQFNKLFYERLINNEDITLMSPAETGSLYSAMGDDYEVFKRIYEKYENNRNVKMKKKISARKLAEIFTKERLETGRIYVMNIDNANEHGSWAVPVYMSNLCQEIIHPTTPISSIDDPNGEIGICILSALNLLELHNDDDITQACRMAVRTLESVIDYQDYPVLAGENFTKNRRSLGIGITNFAGYLAKHKLKYEDPQTLSHVHELMEKIQWNLINESCVLAEQLGSCAKFNETKYSQGLLPIDWYKKTVDELVSPSYKMNWEDLRERVKKYGLRHSTLSAIMPCESSSVIQNSTNGIEPVRSLMSYKKAKNGILKQLVPNYSSRKNYYTLAWEMQNNKAILNICAILQKFVDMSISVNLYYNYAHYPDGNIPLSVLIKDQIYGFKYGVKNFYYCNTPDSDGETEKDMYKKEETCEGGACSI